MVKARYLGGYIQNAFSRKELLFGSDDPQFPIILKAKRNIHHLSSISEVLFSPVLAAKVSMARFSSPSENVSTAPENLKQAHCFLRVTHAMFGPVVLAPSCR